MNTIYIRSLALVTLLLAVVLVQGQEPDTSSASSADSLYVPQASPGVMPMSMGIASTTGLTVSTFAGSGTQGFINGTGIAARFYYPAGGAFDAAGNLYIADVFNHRIRKITPAGVVSTFAGSGSQGSANGTGTSATFLSRTGLPLMVRRTFT